MEKRRYKKTIRYTEQERVETTVSKLDFDTIMEAADQHMTDRSGMIREILSAWAHGERERQRLAIEEEGQILST